LSHRFKHDFKHLEEDDVAPAGKDLVHCLMLWGLGVVGADTIQQDLAAVHEGGHRKSQIRHGEHESHQWVKLCVFCVFWIRFPPREEGRLRAVGKHNEHQTGDAKAIHRWV